DYLNSAQGEAAWEYWRARLAGELPLLALPSDYPTAKNPRYEGASESITIGPETTCKLKELAHRHGASLFTILLAAYKVLLHRYTHQIDIIVGAPSSGRVQERFASVVGNFVNPIALRTHPSPDLPFSDYLQQVRDTVLGALAHQDFPFPVLVERLQPGRHGNEWPIYQTMFVLQQAQSGIDQDLSQLALGEDGSVLSLGDWRVHPMAIHERVENFDLKLMAAECEQGLVFSFQYRSDLFRKETVTHMAAHFGSLWEGMVTAPGQRLSQLPLLGENESQRILQGWNATQVRYPEAGWLPELFERQVQRTPASPALLFGVHSVTYGELNARANRLACALRRRGVGPDAIVAICARRSVEMVVGLLGILKAGGAYLPLDPDSPRERLATMLEGPPGCCYKPAWKPPCHLSRER
ncbi:MAG: condensation domain-containing protein, partial [Gammaproteobacteria bacterium]